MEKQLHSHHDNIAKRLKRASGHLQSVIDMIEAERPCLEIAQQLYAVEKAISQAKKVLIQDHIDHCLEHSIEVSKNKNDQSSKSAIKEFKEITKYL